jgi:RNA polymerase sigma factor (TIGR02999 family)
MTDVTQLLKQIENGNPAAADDLLPLVYEELRKLANQKLENEMPGQTLQATALVHEAYLRLIGADRDVHFDNRGHFFAAAAEAMRRLLVERARKRKTEKHGGAWQRVELQENDLLSFTEPDQVLELSTALERLETEDKVAASVVKLCMFGGFSVDQTGELLGMSRASAYRNWSFARAWLKSEMSRE